ncbi:hypothetical protein JAAARDRAFT_34071 [Jaapia argillacea MUCL 33604]|uniref:Uncharacterized protein n=1 Tax=Jaapia argillacea MUCL 33604 TaxID=933084 RepID=A0A067PZM3_9AGAM|nr:hypothetical protein JAAARDRAFT_34071 [Jaapia argillacea MUCL 33604]
MLPLIPPIFGLPAIHPCYSSSHARSLLSTGYLASPSNGTISLSLELDAEAPRQNCHPHLPKTLESQRSSCRRFFHPPQATTARRYPGNLDCTMNIDRSRETTDIRP